MRKIKPMVLMEVRRGKTMKYEKIFSPLTLKKCTFQNRIMRTSMVSGLATEDGFVTDVLKQRYRREAKGGVGSIMVEASVVLPSKSPYNLRISDERFNDGFKELIEVIREANPETRIGIQIMHFLKIARSGWRQKVEDFKPEELPIIVEQHVAATKRAVSAGFDFIELHMAHAFTLSSFLSRVNKRTDEYGGNFENRMRLPIEVYQAIREEAGDDFPLGIRINGEDFIVNGNTLLQSTRVARRFAELGVDYISVSAGDRFEDAVTPLPDTPPDPMSGYSGHRMSPWWWFPDATHVYLAEEIRKYIHDGGLNVPIITTGKIRTPQLAEQILQEGKADMIGLCRALLCDPDWPIKAKEGREKDIVRCTACNWCIESDSRYEKVNCSRWPEGSSIAPEPFLPAIAGPSKIPNEAN
ncbi:NADH:flavin oxidoreductase [Chloroflexota bacterium]